MCEIFTAIGGALGASASTAGATGVAAVGTGVSAAAGIAAAAAQARAAKAAGKGAGYVAPPKPQAEAYRSPEASPGAGEGPTTRRSLMINLGSAKGAGLQVRTPGGKV